MNSADTEIIDALVTLCRIPAGDVYQKINDGEFEELAIQALRSFNRQFQTTWDKWIDKKPDTSPVDDLTILEECLRDLEEEIALKMEQLDLSDPSNQNHLDSLSEEAEDFRRRIQISKEKSNDDAIREH